MLAHLLLGVAQVAGLLLIPFTSIGIWLQLGSLLLYSWWSGFQPVGAIPLVILVALGLSTAIAEVPVRGGPRAEDSRRRMGFAGVLGGALGAAAGVPFPLLGSMFGALLGAAIATLLAALMVSSEGGGCATLGGQVFATTLRTAAGVVIAVFTLLTIIS